MTFKLVSKMPNSAKPISLKDNREGFKKKSPLIIYLKVKPGYVIKQVEEKSKESRLFLNGPTHYLFIVKTPQPPTLLFSVYHRLKRAAAP